ncbi:hypothetical protein SUDANB120_02897 [Streptomyces sp. enrichment culture]|uniref:hypothetical protein n=1 Tax=Streptomyces TaxID=1883 RepID=UPI001679F160|nr:MULTISPECIES: hypothetical protein [Streptomyces]MBD3577305.1 hypothetical protein [Streptomyces sp. KD18]GGT01710.1 hypothetical protein GCM10010286_28530 [Streptomyces toxytricini]
MDPHPGAPPAPEPETFPLIRPGAQEPPTAHAASTTERGSFCLAVCGCGWRGPARRSRDLARRDAAEHGAA